MALILIPCSRRPRMKESRGNWWASVLTEAAGDNDGRTPLLILCSRRPRFRKRRGTRCAFALQRVVTAAVGPVRVSFLRAECQQAWMEHFVVLDAHSRSDGQVLLYVKSYLTDTAGARRM